MAIYQFSSTLKYDQYYFPPWASVGLALLIILVSIIIIPIYMIWYFWTLDEKTFEASNILKQKIRFLKKHICILSLETGKFEKS